MSNEQDRLNAVFSEALAKASPEERNLYLAEACGLDAELRQAVDSLIAAHEGAGDFLRRPVLGGRNGGAAGEGPGAVIGRYKLLQQIGEGGFGLVFMAEQQEPVRRMVALKIIKAGMDTKEVIARFEAERQALALMDHPNIAHVLDGGTTATGRPYFVMDLVKGIPITEFCDQNQLSTEARLRLFLQVCAGVQHAHQKGVIHRDLKPSNVLVAVSNGEPIPKIIDFGVAKAIGQKLTERTLFTRFEQLIGTPAYMSPEQAEWGGVDIDTRSDIYSLGVLLYELLTGTTPFEKETLARVALDEVRRMIREKEPPMPSTRLRGLGQKLTEVARDRQTGAALLARLVQGDLDCITMRAMEKERNRRYETVIGLARDLERYLSGDPVTARPPSKLYRMRKFVLRNRVGVTTGTASCLALMLLVVGAFIWQARQTAKIRRLADENQQQIARYEEANGKSMLDDNPAASLPWFVEALGSAALNSERDRVNRILLASILGEHPRLLCLFTNATPFWSCAFSPDGHKLLGWGSDGLTVFAVESGNRLWQTQTQKDVAEATTLASWSGDGQRVILSDLAAKFRPEVYGSEDGRRIALKAPTGQHHFEVLDTLDGRTGLVLEGNSTAQLYDLELGAPLSPPLDTGAEIHSGRLAADLEHFALVFGTEPYVRVWAAHAGAVSPKIKATGLRELVLSSRGKRLYWGPATEEGVVVLDARTGEEIVPPAKGIPFEPLLTSAGFQWLKASAGSPVYWNFETDETFKLPGHVAPSAARYMALASDALLIATAINWGQAFVINRLTGAVILPPLNHARWAFGVAFSPDTRLLATCSADCTLRIWDLAATRTEEFVLRHSAEVTGLAVSPNGTKLLTASAAVPGLRLWDSSSGKSLVTFPAASLGDVSFSSKGDHFLAFGGTKPSQPGWGICVGDTQKGGGLRWLDEQEVVDEASFTSDARRVISGARGPSNTSTFRVWAIGSNEARLAFTNEGKLEGACLAISPDGAYLASLNLRGPANVWDLETGRKVGALAGGFDSVEFSPDGTLLATGCADQSARLWNLATLQQMTPPLFQGGTPMDQKFSPDGRLLATRGHGTGLRLWDVRTGRLLFPTFPFHGLIYDFGFSHNGRYLVAAGRELSGDGAARVWDTSTGEPVTVALRHLNGVFSAQFSGDGHRLFTAGAEGDVRSWRLTQNNWPVPELREMAELLASAKLDPTGTLMPLSCEELMARYHRLRTRHPEFFRPSTLRQQALWQDFISEIALSSGQWKAVIWHLDRAFRIDPTLEGSSTAEELFGRRGRADAELGDLSQAAIDFARAVRLAPDKLCLWQSLALCSIGRGAGDYARICSQALKKFWAPAMASNRVASTYSYALGSICAYGPNTESNLISATRTVLWATHIDPHNPALAGTLGGLLYRTGNYREAVQQLQRSYQASLPIARFEDLFFLAMTYQKLGQSEVARRFLLKAVAVRPHSSRTEGSEDPQQPSWQSRVAYQILRAEAERLLNARTKPSPDSLNSCRLPRDSILLSCQP